MIDKVNILDKGLTSLRNEYEEKETIDARRSILRFGDEIGHGLRPSKEHFEQILKDIDYYEIYCKTHANFENSVATATIAKIKKVYQRNLENDTFID